ncbi:MAG: hypothetical protein V1793_04140 [Pseudomonadota bacterium]
MKLDSLSDRADTDLIALPNGRLLRIGDARRLKAAGQRMKAAAVRGNRLPAGLKTKPAATGAPVKTMVDLAAAFKRPDSETLVLPNGSRLTVAQLKFIQPMVEKQLGRKLDVATGPVTPVKTRIDLAAVLERPDIEAVQFPSGNVFTVADIKAARPDVEKRLGYSLYAAQKKPAAMGAVIRVAKNVSTPDWKNILKQPDDTVLESPGGKRITVGNLKKVMGAANIPIPADGNSKPLSAPGAMSTKKTAPAKAPKQP